MKITKIKLQKFQGILKLLKKHLASGGVACSFISPAYENGHYITIHEITGDNFFCDDPLFTLKELNSKIKSF